MPNQPASLDLAMDALERARTLGLAGALALAAVGVPLGAFALLARSRLSGGAGWRAA